MAPQRGQRGRRAHTQRVTQPRAFAAFATFVRSTCAQRRSTCWVYMNVCMLSTLTRLPIGRHSVWHTARVCVCARVTTIIIIASRAHAQRGARLHDDTTNTCTNLHAHAPHTFCVCVVPYETVQPPQQRQSSLFRRRCRLCVSVDARFVCARVFARRKHFETGSAFISVRSAERSVVHFGWFDFGCLLDCIFVGHRSRNFVIVFHLHRAVTHIIQRVYIPKQCYVRKCHLNSQTYT